MVTSAELQAREAPRRGTRQRSASETYVREQRRADFYKKMGEFSFWGGTTLLAGAVGALGFGGHLANLTGLWTTIVATGWFLPVAGVALAAFVGSFFFSHKATDIAERSNVLYSEIDSRNQARHLVQELSRAQSAGEIDGNPLARNDGRSWADTVSRSNNNGTWADRVSAEEAGTQRTR